MNKLFFIFLITFTFPYIINAQSGNITYTVKMANDDLNSLTGEAKEMQLKIYEIANKIKFNLHFNKNQSSFNVEKSITESSESEKIFENIALSLTAGASIYIDHSKKIELSLEYDNTIVSNIYEVKNWEIKKESRKIDKYLCYKAIQNIKFTNRKGEIKTREVIAWFAPSIPYKYGPKNFFGLPGLIIELQEYNVTYFATKIDLLKKETLINFPKGKKITKEEYDRKLKEQMGM